MEWYLTELIGEDLGIVPVYIRCDRRSIMDGALYNGVVPRSKRGIFSPKLWKKSSNLIEAMTYDDGGDTDSIKYVSTLERPENYSNIIRPSFFCF